MDGISRRRYLIAVEKVLNTAQFTGLYAPWFRLFGLVIVLYPTYLLFLHFKKENMFIHCSPLLLMKNTPKIGTSILETFLLWFSELKVSLYQTLGNHAIRNLFKGCDVSTCKVVCTKVVFFSSFFGCVEDICHDVFKTAVYFFTSP